MVEFGKILWNAETSDRAQTPKKNVQANPFDSVCELAQQKIPGITVFDQFKVLQKEMAEIKSSHEKFVDTIATVPFISSFLLWLDEFSKKNSLIIHIGKALIQKDFIGTCDSSGKIWSMKSKTSMFSKR